MWHKADWEKVKEDPTAIHFPRQDWIFEHDAEKHAEEVYDETVAARKQRESAAEPLETPVAVDAPRIESEQQQQEKGVTIAAVRELAISA
jgi:hypothetical protein